MDNRLKDAIILSVAHTSLPSSQEGITKHMNILAIDFGTKNIGLARASIAVKVAMPFGIVRTVDELVKLIQQEKIEKIIIGLPLGLGGEENKNTARVRNFADELKQKTGLPVEFISEIFSSQAADRMGGGASRDEKSAMVILQSYLHKISA